MNLSKSLHGYGARYISSFILIHGNIKER